MDAFLIGFEVSGKAPVGDRRFPTVITDLFTLVGPAIECARLLERAAWSNVTVIERRAFSDSSEDRIPIKWQGSGEIV